MRSHPLSRLRLPPALLLASALLAASPAGAETFPSRPIRIVAPNTASTPPEIIGRIIANELTRAEGWSVIVENRPGAITTLAGAEVLRQAADGHTLFAMSVPSAAAPALVANIPYRLSDFAPIAKISTSYNVLVVHPAVPAHSVAELVALLKSRPDQLTFSSGGFGTPAHLIGELFKLQTGVRATHVPYQQFPQAIGDLLGGTNQFMFVTMLPVVDLIKTGKLRALAVMAAHRVAALPDVPTIVEQGFPALVAEDWVGLAARRGTPPEIVSRLNGAVNAALAQPSVRDALLRLGAEPAGGTPEDYGTLLRAEEAMWARVIRESGIKM